MEFKKCVIESPYVCRKEGVFYRGKVYIIADPPIYHPFHENPCKPVAEVDGQFLYCINDCAYEDDCFVVDNNTVIIRANNRYGLVDVMSGEVLLCPLYDIRDVEEKMMAERIS